MSFAQLAIGCKVLHGRVFVDLNFGNTNAPLRSACSFVVLAAACQQAAIPGHTVVIRWRYFHAQALIYRILRNFLTGLYEDLYFLLFLTVFAVQRFEHFVGGAALVREALHTLDDVGNPRFWRPSIRFLLLAAVIAFFRILACFYFSAIAFEAAITTLRLVELVAFYSNLI